MPLSPLETLEWQREEGDIDHYHRIIPLYLQKFISIFAIVGAFILTTVVIINFN